LLDHGLGFNVATLALVVGMVVSRMIVTLVSMAPGIVSITWRHKLRATVHTIPEGIVIALACLVVSRVFSFQPGYLYGLVVAVDLGSRELETERRDALLVQRTLGLVGVAMLAWFAWIPFVNAYVDGHRGLLVLLGDGIFASTFLVGIDSAILSLIPLKPAPASGLYRARRRLWLGLGAAATFLFAWIVLHPAGEFVGTLWTNEQWLHALIPFGIFGSIAVGFWLSFGRTAVAPPDGAAAPPIPEAPEPA
jgi:hypothetical protein